LRAIRIPIGGISVAGSIVRMYPAKPLMTDRRAAFQLSVPFDRIAHATASSVVIVLAPSCSRNVAKSFSSRWCSTSLNPSARRIVR
jgi:hypothetical protein